ncbi:RHS repeat domain-containing protein, partial [Flavobacterium columnare]|uniref:RHS repeat domain-containing protein n=2 Tax=Flavobacterium columnare TaxID=996 RepID=UPI0011BE44A7
FEKDIFYYHSDHLGSTSYISTMNGQLSQHVEYIAFGEVLFEEHSSSFSMPYLFNGKELDRETNLSYYGARYLDMKTSLWLNIDPLAEKYPNISPYAYVANNPVNAIDPDGRDIIFVVNKDGKDLQYTYRNRNFYHDGKRYNPGKENVSKTMYRVLSVYRKIEASKDKNLKGILHHLENSETSHYIYGNTQGENFVMAEKGMKRDPKTKKIVDGKTLYTRTQLDLDEKGGNDFKGIGETDMTTVVHETRHQYDHDIDNMGDNSDKNNQNDPAEIRAVHLENKARDVEGLKHRTKYGGKIDSKKLQNPPNNKMPE